VVIEVRKPNILCIGAQKAGTSWLHEVLSEHPKVWTPPFKELHFFDHKFIPANRKWTQGHVRKGIRNAKFSHTMTCDTPDQEYIDYLESILSRPMFNGNWYKNVFSFAPKNTSLLDVTPEYSCVPEEGVEFIDRFLPRCKFIYILRDPSDRAVSQLKMNIMRKTNTPRTDSEWLDFASDNVIKERGDYASYVPRWMAKIPKSRLLFIPFGQIRSEPEALLKKIESFCCLSHHTYRRLNKKVFKGPNVAVPKSVHEKFVRELADQNSFIIDTFGKDFFLQTK